MAGTFAHITLVDKLCMDADLLDSIGTLTNDMKLALTEFCNFCELGSVSPDLPYLKVLSKDAARWGDVMHYWKTADFVRKALSRVQDMDLALTDSQKCLAWLFGYTAHLVTDLTVHPVINLKVGPYAQNALEHRRCEVNQDVYIFHKKGFGEVTTAEYIRNCGLGSCSDGDDHDKMDGAIRKLWTQSLAVSRDSIWMANGAEAPEKDPDPDEWFHHYVAMIDKFAEEKGRMPYLLRYIMEAEAVVYPTIDEMKMEYIQNLKLPDGSYADYDQVYDTAQKNIASVWRELGSAIAKKDISQFTLANGNLDTGLDDRSPLIFWKDIA